MAKDITSKQAGTFQENEVNNPTTRTIRGKNLFPQSFQHPSTCRYGEVDVVMAAKVEPGDVFPYKFDTDLNTFTLASPMKSKVKMKSAAFKVPMQAIYPRNWERMFTTPTHGDDVPEDIRAVFDINTYWSILFDNLSDSLSLDIIGDYVILVLHLEQIFSAGSLFSKLNLHLDHCPLNVYDEDGVKNGTQYFDRWFDTVFANWLRERLLTVEYPIVNKDKPYLTFGLLADEDDLSYNTISRKITFRRALELLRTGEYTISDDVTFGPTKDSLKIDYKVIGYDPINIEPIIAYQLACAHFFTNSKVDFIYSAQLYRDNLQSIWFLSTGSPLLDYDYNGVSYQYDVFSKAYFDTYLADGFIFDGFFFNLFQWQRSLRYGDYFTGSRVEPLAVGDINAPVIDGSVNALDMTRKLQVTRYLNKANITGPRFADYLRGIFGMSLPEAPKDVPVKLSDIAMNVEGFEVNNTGSDQLDSSVQNITTTNLRLSENRYMFEANIDEPAWIIVVQYFEAHRIYSRTMDRFAFHYDRYDDFLPDLQFIGDQEVKAAELDYLNSPNGNFAYNLRYMEYKQRYSYASGGFINALKTWAFITDNNDGNPSYDGNKISPEYIRSSPSEFDRFYKSLTGYSMGTYFHFITFNTNVVAPYRQMVYAPEILA